MVNLDIFRHNYGEEEKIVLMTHKIVTNNCLQCVKVDNIAKALCGVVQGETPILLPQPEGRVEDPGVR